MALRPSYDDSRDPKRDAEVHAPDSAPETGDQCFEQRFAHIHAALLDLRRGDLRAQVVIRTEMGDLGDAEALLAAERVQEILTALPPATNLVEAKAALYVARDVGPYLHDLGAELFHIAAQHGLAASTHSVTRSAYLEIADKAFDLKKWEGVKDFAIQAISLAPTPEEGERVRVAFCSAHAILASAYSVQCRMEEALYCADSIRHIVDSDPAYFEKLLGYGLPHEVVDMEAAAEALMTAGSIYREEVKPASFDSAFGTLLGLLQGTEPLHRTLRVRALVRYAAEQRLLSDLVDGSTDESLTPEAVLESALKNVDAALEIVADQGADWSDARLHGDALRVKADILVEREDFIGAASDAEQALAQYHRSEAFGIGCRDQKNEVIETLQLCRDKIENALSESEDDPSVDDDDDESGEGFLPPNEWEPD